MIGWPRLRLSLGRSPGIRTRLVLWYTAMLAVVLVCFSATIYLGLSQSLYSELDSSLQAESELVAKAIRISRDLTVTGGAPPQLPPDTAVSVFGQSGRSFVRLSGSDLLHPTERMAASAESGQSIFGTETIRGENWRVYTRPILRSGQLVAVIEVGQPTTDIERTLRQRLEMLAATVPITLLLATSGGVFLSSRALGPVEQIIQTVRAIQAEDLSRRVEGPTSDDEIGRLARTFNAMLDRVEGAFQRERQFTGDAAHELRTPLAVIKSQIEVTLAQPRSASDYRATLQSIEEDVDNLNLLVRKLLDLARSDTRAASLVREPVDLTAIARTSVTSFARLAAKKGLSLSVDGARPVLVLGDAERLGQLVRNLVENALEYNTTGRRVVVRVESVGDAARLAVADDGPGIAREHLPHLFERFYRIDKARARAAGHHGLGLSVCAAIAAEHGGQIAVESEVGRGSTVTFTMPQLDATPPGEAVADGVGADAPAIPLPAVVDASGAGRERP